MEQGEEELAISRQDLSLSGAYRIMEAALMRAREIGVEFAIAITDRAGGSILQVRMNGAPRGAVDIALNKAHTVASFNGVSTAAWWPSIRDDPALVHGITHTPRLIVFPGGVGVFSGDHLIGAIGVSGGEPGQDADVANYAAAGTITT